MKIKNIISLSLFTIGILFNQSCQREGTGGVIPTAADNTGIYLKTVADKTTPLFETNFETAKVDLLLQVGGNSAESRLEEVQMYLTYKDSEKVFTGAEKLVATFKPSDFTKDATTGLLTRNFVYSPKQLFALLGITDTKIYDNSDIFQIRFAAKDKSGRLFSTNNLGDELAATSYFNTPFIYSYTVKCEFSPTMFQGNFAVVSDGWGDYSAGDIVPVKFVAPDEIQIWNTNNPYLINASTSYIKVKITDKLLGNATVSYNEPFNYNPIINPSGTATLDNCTGTISMTITWGTYGTYRTFIKKQ